MNIKDIAQLCGVSPSTVSKILHNKDEAISVETRKKVLEVIKEYQYVPYSKVLKNGAPKTNTIAVLVNSDIYGTHKILYSVEQAAAKNGYSIILCNTDGEEEKWLKHLKILQNKNLDGIISICQKWELPQNITPPAVCVTNHKSQGGKGSVAQLFYEEEEAGYRAVHFLLSQGHSRIACVLERDDTAIEEGCKKAFREKYMDSNKDMIFLGTGEEIRNYGLSKCLGLDCTAIVCANVEIGNLAYEKLWECGESVPENVSVVSVRDAQLAEQIKPHMTAVDIPFQQMGIDAVGTLLEIMEGRKSGDEYYIKSELSVIERNSVKSPMEHIQGGKIVVVGSMNMDCIINVSHIPTNGETLSSRTLALLPGGKGANQAVGAGKLEGNVYMIGCLGNDGDGKEIYNNLVNSGVKMDGVVFNDTLPTGKAYVNVASDGESTVVIYAGANARLDCHQVRRFRHFLDQAKYCLLTLEISEETVEYTIQTCRDKQVEVILKPAAVVKMKESLFEKIDYLIPNEKEVKQLIPEESSIEKKAEILLKKGVKNVIVTLGHKGCYLKNHEYACFFPAAKFHAVDTTGGADAFISAFAVYMSEGFHILEAIGFATYGAGISITRQGVQAALIDRTGLDMYRDEIQDKFLKAIADSKKIHYQGTF